MRCKGCDKIMDRVDRESVNPHTGDYEELCRRCLSSLLSPTGLPSLVHPDDPLEFDPSVME